ncbi:hypothetical protein [Mycolicibacterium thermoresistibile]
MDENIKARAGIAVAAALLLVIIVRFLGRKRANVIATTTDIENMIAALDPASRAAVLARLSHDGVDVVKERLGR